MKEGALNVWIGKMKQLKRKRTLIGDLQQLIAIPSVLDESAATEDSPFGPEPKRALDWLLKKDVKQELL